MAIAAHSALLFGRRALRWVREAVARRTVTQYIYSFYNSPLNFNSMRHLSPSFAMRKESVTFMFFRPSVIPTP